MTSTVTDVTHTSPRVAAIAAFKGGVGKTTSTANVASSWAISHPDAHGLVIDLDPQGNLTEAFESYIDRFGSATSASLLNDATHDPSVRLTAEQMTRLTLPTGRLDLLPAGDGLTHIEETLTTQAGGERFLRRLLDTAHGYDFILIDTRPSDGRLTLNAVCASRHVIAVVNPARWSAEGAARVQGFVQRAIDFGLADTVFLGSMVNKVEGGRRLGRDQVLSDLEDTDATLLTPYIPLRTATSDAEYLGDPVVFSEPKSPTARAYAQLAETLWAATAAETSEGVQTA